MSGKKRKLAVTRDKCDARASPFRSPLPFSLPPSSPLKLICSPSSLGCPRMDSVVKQIWREAAMCSSISGRGQDRRYERCPSPTPRCGGYAESGVTAAREMK